MISGWMKWGLFACGVLALSGCSNREEQVTFDGQYYRAKVGKVDGDRQQISVEVRPVSVSLDGAREAGRYEATKYCIENFGTSDIDWIVGPDDAEESLVISDDRLTLRGSCRF